MIFSILQGIMAFIIVISVLVFIHEYGHYLGCKICKVKVDSFSIGMGKEIFGWNDKNNVRWKISLLPIGGYLKMFGDSDASSGKADKQLLQQMSEEDKKVSFYFQNPYKKLLIVVFGPLFNLILAIIFFTFIIRVNGITHREPIIDKILNDSPASRGGLMDNDYVYSLNDNKINDFSEIINYIAINNLKPIKFKIIRNGEQLDIIVQPELKNSQDMFGNTIEAPYVGISSTVSIKKVNIFVSFIEANKTVYKICKDTLIVLGQMITGNRGTDGLGGPLKIAKYSAQSFSKGFIMVIRFMALISANLGLMNLLPIPVLDGGHLFFFIIEIITKREIPEKIQTILLNCGFYFLLAVMFFSTFNDLRSFIR